MRLLFLGKMQAAKGHQVHFHGGTCRGSTRKYSCEQKAFDTRHPTKVQELIRGGPTFHGEWLGRCAVSFLHLGTLAQGQALLCDMLTCWYGIDWHSVAPWAKGASGSVAGRKALPAAAYE